MDAPPFATSDRGDESGEGLSDAWVIGSEQGELTPEASPTRRWNVRLAKKASEVPRSCVHQIKFRPAIINLRNEFCTKELA